MHICIRALNHVEKALCSWQIVTCPLIDVPKFYRRCGFNSAPSNHWRLCKGHYHFLVQALPGLYLLSFTHPVSFIIVFSIKSPYPQLWSTILRVPHLLITIQTVMRAKTDGMQKMGVLCQRRNGTKTVNHVKPNCQPVIFHSKIALWPIRYEAKMFCSKDVYGKDAYRRSIQNGKKNLQNREMICQMNQFSGSRTQVVAELEAPRESPKTLEVMLCFPCSGHLKNITCILEVRVIPSYHEQKTSGLKQRAIVVTDKMKCP